MTAATKTNPEIDLPPRKGTEVAVAATAGTVTSTGSTGVMPLDRMLDMYERLIRDPDIPVERIQQGAALIKDLMLMKAKIEFDEAMGKAQAEIKPILADRPNKQTGSRYASHKALDTALRPIYSKYGLSISFNTVPSEKIEIVGLQAEVSRGGYSKIYFLEVPADGKGPKGGDVMTKTHAVGSGVTTGIRYLYKMIFNAPIFDDDGNAASATKAASRERDPNEPTVSDAQLKQLRDKIAATGAHLKNFLVWAKVDRLDEILSSEFKSCMTALDDYAAKRKRKK